MAWIGLDDTDTLSGGCTTFEFHRLVCILSDLSMDGSLWRLKDPRLVRLWPFASKRTRGNAALAVKIDIEKKNESILFEILQQWFSELIIRISKLDVIQSDHSGRRQHSPEPCLLYLREQVPEFYWMAVRKEISANKVLKQISGLDGSKYWQIGKKISGLVGALAAISWIGDLDYTWELTAYRFKENYRTQRIISKESIREISEKYPGTFLNRDPNSEKSIISPNTPCPVLYGIRAESENDAQLAHLYLQSIGKNEKSSEFRIWRTNQATGDHIEKTFTSTLMSNPKIIKGGHVILNVLDNGNHLNQKELVAFSESGNVNTLAQKLTVGDIIQWEGMEANSKTIHLEKLRLMRAKLRNCKRPTCICGYKYISLGKNKPLKCKKCHTLSPRLWNGSCDIPYIWVEPDASQRRHLAKPIERMTLR